MTPEALLLAFILFAMRVVNYAISTLRLVFIARDMRLLSAVTAFMEALIFAVVMASVVTDLSNIANLMAYCLGAAIGSYVGMSLEAHFITSYSSVNIITNLGGNMLAEKLREHGFGVTVTHGEGRDGQVDILRSSANNRDVPLLLDIVNYTQPDAFVQVDSTRAIRRGWIPGGPPRRA
jgi:uncharacterized protein YebE (UPF0316 family)